MRRATRPDMFRSHPRVNPCCEWMLSASVGRLGYQGRGQASRSFWIGDRLKGRTDREATVAGYGSLGIIRGKFQKVNKKTILIILINS